MVENKHVLPSLEIAVAVVVISIHDRQSIKCVHTITSRFMTEKCQCYFVIELIQFMICIWILYMCIGNVNVCGFVFQSSNWFQLCGYYVIAIFEWLFTLNTCASTIPTQAIIQNGINNKCYIMYIIYSIAAVNCHI